MEEVKNHEKKEGSCFRHCLGGNCHNCSWGHKIAKIVIVVIIVGALICIGAALGSRNSRLGDRGDLMMNSFCQGKVGGQGNCSGGCGRQNDSGKFCQGNRMMNQQQDNQEFGAGCSQGAKCNNANCPLNQAGQVNNPAGPIDSAPFIPVNTSTPSLQ